MSGVLLLGADYYGTLAAARCYGAHGVDVTMADETRGGRALFSRFVRDKLVHPPLATAGALVDWLVDFGERNPHTLLYPPNDHLAWLFAAEHDRLGRAFDTYAPPESAVFRLLDKPRLHDACAAVGIDVPETRVLDGGDGWADGLRWPALIKPRTQVFLESGIKGFIVHDRAELDREIERFRALVRFAPVLTERHPEVAQPMVQEYLTAAETSIFSVSGFVTEDGRAVCRAAMKVLQRPRKVGIGLCFESRELDAALTERLVALCRHVGYHGAFEAEFIADGGRHLLIDFNPRFYSQMAFDIARGVPLPMLVYWAASGDRARLDAELEAAQQHRPAGDEVYCHRTMLDLVLTLQGLSGQMSRGDVRRWRAWVRTHAATMTDAVRDPADRVPALVDAASWVRHFARHPRSFVRSFVLNR